MTISKKIFCIPLSLCCVSGFAPNNKGCIDVPPTVVTAARATIPLANGSSRALRSYVRPGARAGGDPNIASSNIPKNVAPKEELGHPVYPNRDKLSPWGLTTTENKKAFSFHQEKPGAKDASRLLLGKELPEYIAPEKELYRLPVLDRLPAEYKEAHSDQEIPPSVDASLVHNNRTSAFKFCYKLPLFFGSCLFKWPAEKLCGGIERLLLRWLFVFLASELAPKNV